MTLQEAVDRLEMKPLSALAKLSAEVSGGYVSDLLSDVMANAKAGDIWVTLQTHQNISRGQLEGDCRHCSHRRPGSRQRNSGQGGRGEYPPSVLQSSILRSSREALPDGDFREEMIGSARCKTSPYTSWISSKTPWRPELRGWRSASPRI